MHQRIDDILGETGLIDVKPWQNNKHHHDGFSSDQLHILENASNIYSDIPVTIQCKFFVAEEQCYKLQLVLLKNDY